MACRLFFFSLMSALCLSWASAHAVIFYDITTKATETVDGSSWQDGDIFRYEPIGGVASPSAWESWFSNNVEVQAFDYLPNGNLVLSTTGDATLWGLNFTAGDLVEVDPTTTTATLFFDRDLFDGSYYNSYWSIDALDILDSGNLLISTSGSERLGGLTFQDGDLVEYNPVTDTASLFLSESIFSENEDIDAVHMLNNGDVVLSTRGSATIGSLSFTDGQLVQYNIATGNAWVILGENIFSDDADINGVYVAEVGTAIPEPQTYLLLGSLLMVVYFVKRRQTFKAEAS